MKRKLNNNIIKKLREKFLENPSTSNNKIKRLEELVQILSEEVVYIKSIIEKNYGKNIT